MHPQFALVSDPTWTNPSEVAEPYLQALPAQPRNILGLAVLVSSLLHLVPVSCCCSSPDVVLRTGAAARDSAIERRKGDAVIITVRVSYLNLKCKMRLHCQFLGIFSFGHLIRWQVKTLCVCGLRWGALQTKPGAR